MLNQFSDIAEVLNEPEQKNGIAIHGYQKVGLQIAGQFINTWYSVPHYLMRLNMLTLNKTSDFLEK